MWMSAITATFLLSLCRSERSGGHVGPVQPVPNGDGGHLHHHGPQQRDSLLPQTSVRVLYSVRSAEATTHNVWAFGGPWLVDIGTLMTVRWLSHRGPGSCHSDGFPPVRRGLPGQWPHGSSPPRAVLVGDVHRLCGGRPYRGWGPLPAAGAALQPLAEVPPPEGQRFALHFCLTGRDVSVSQRRLSREIASPLFSGFTCIVLEAAHAVRRVRALGLDYVSALHIVCRADTARNICADWGGKHRLISSTAWQRPCCCVCILLGWIMLKQSASLSPIGRRTNYVWMTSFYY